MQRLKFEISEVMTEIEHLTCVREPYVSFCLTDYKDLFNIEIVLVIFLNITLLFFTTLQQKHSEEQADSCWKKEIQYGS